MPTCLFPRVRRASAVAIAVMTIVTACSRDSSENRSDTGLTGTAGDSAMAGMPGMADTATASSTVSFSAAQIAHGGIKWAPAAQTLIAGSVEVSGQLVANEDRTARLAAPAQARVLAVHVSPGQRVSAGAGLVTLQSTEASMAQADLAKAQSELASRRAQAAYAKSARDRAERLLALKAIPRQDYERAIADDELARAGVIQAVAELQRARSNASQLGIDVRAGTMTLRSPMSGVVTTREAIPGAVVSAGSPLVTVTDPNALWLTAALPEAFASGVQVGSRLRFTVPAFPGETFSARVQSVSASFDPATRSLPIRGLVVNTQSQLRPEMFARVWIETGTRQSFVTVPEAAVQRMDGTDVVFVAHPDSRGGARFDRREVRIGGTSEGRTAIVSGLAPGDAVVVDGAYAVKAELEKGKMPKMEM
ncbi:MAG TPA: efflux RND transporter periplasmic adaptor subunit [Gemmatimonadaceae bacterium]